MQPRKNPFFAQEKKIDIYESINTDDLIPEPKYADPTPQDFRDDNSTGKMKEIRRQQRKYQHDSGDNSSDQVDEEPADANEMEFLPNKRISDFNVEREPLHHVPRASSKHRTSSINTPRDSLSLQKVATMDGQNRMETSEAFKRKAMFGTLDSQMGMIATIDDEITGVSGFMQHNSAQANTFKKKINISEIEKRSHGLEQEFQLSDNLNFSLEKATPDGSGKVDVGVSCCFDAPLQSPEEVYFRQRINDV